MGHPSCLLLGNPLSMNPNVRKLNHLIMTLKSFGNGMAFGFPSLVFEPLLYFTWCSSQILDHPVEVKTSGILVPVPVLADLIEPAVLEDHAVVTPEN